MVISENKVVSLIYELRLNSYEGEIIEAITADSPLSFIYGTGGLLPKFEENIHGLKTGDSFDFGLKSDEAYGEINNDAIVNIPIAAFEVDGKIDNSLLTIGNKIPMQDGSGNKLTGIVQKADNDHVTMDFNHPLAGNDLFFKGEIAGIREATHEELNSKNTGNCDDCSCCGEHNNNCC